VLKNALFDGVVFRSDLSNICLVASLQTMLCLWYVDLSIAFYLDLFLPSSNRRGSVSKLWS